MVATCSCGNSLGEPTVLHIMGSTRYEANVKSVLTVTADIRAMYNVLVDNILENPNELATRYTKKRKNRPD